LWEESEILEDQLDNQYESTQMAKYEEERERKTKQKKRRKDAEKGEK